MDLTINIASSGSSASPEQHVVQVLFPEDYTPSHPRASFPNGIDLEKGFTIKLCNHGDYKINVSSSPRPRVTVPAKRVTTNINRIGCTKAYTVKAYISSLHEDDYLIDVPPIKLSDLEPRTPRARGSATKAKKPHATAPVVPEGENLFELVKKVQDAIKSGDVSWRLRNGELVFLVMTEI